MIQLCMHTVLVINLSGTLSSRYSNVPVSYSKQNHTRYVNAAGAVQYQSLGMLYMPSLQYVLLTHREYDKIMHSTSKLSLPC